jgi:hypothetical protein
MVKLFLIGNVLTLNNVTNMTKVVPLYILKV